jgi:hypothetical protein
MPSRRDQIIADVVTALEGVGKPSGLTVHRFRTRALTSERFPAVVVYPVAEESSRAPIKTSGLTDRRVRIVCECRTTAGADETVDEALDPLVSWVVSAVMADPRRGGLAVETQDVETTWAVTEDADRTYCGAAVVIEVRYLTAADDPAAAN